MRMHDERRLPPGPRWPAAAVRLAMKRAPLRLFEHGFARHGDVVRYDAPPLRYVVVARPELVEHVLLRSYRDYDKSARHPVLVRLLGDGVIMTNGDRWRQQRKALAPAFQPKQLAGLVDRIVATTTETVEGWRRRGDTEVDVHAELGALTRRVVGGALFGLEGDETAGRLGDALDLVVERVNVRAERPWHLGLRYPTPRNRRFFRAADTIDRFVQGLIRDRREGRGGDDVLTALMHAHEVSGQPRLDDTELRDEILNLFFAGFETSASALTWTFLLLSRYPAAARRVSEEVARVVGDGPLRFEHLGALEYTGWVLSESMRLFPPIWTNERVAMKDDELDGHFIPQGTMVAISIWLLHHHPRLWEHPERFDPERFSPQRSQGRSRYTYVPFGVGPRTCVGNHFATMQAKVMLATVVRRLAIDIPLTVPRPTASITLRPSGPVPGRLRAL